MYKEEKEEHIFANETLSCLDVLLMIIAVLIGVFILMFPLMNLMNKLELTTCTIERGVLAQAVNDVYPEQSTDLTARVIEWNNALAHNQYWTTRLFSSWFLNSGWLDLKPIPMPRVN